MKEENIYTNTGIDTPAASTLWKLVKDDVRLRNRVIAIIKNYQRYYVSLSDVKNAKARMHFIKMIAAEADNIALNVEEPKITTYLRNVLKYIYRKALDDAIIAWKAEDKKRLHASIRKQLTL